MDNDQSKAKIILENLKKKYCDRYAEAIFDIGTAVTKRGLEVSGEVLVAGQKEDILSSLKAAGVKVRGEKIKVLSDFAEKNELGWGRVKADTADVLSRYVPAGKSARTRLEKIRATQLQRGGAVRVLAKKDNQFLVQTEDLTLGWMKKTDIRFPESKSSASKHRKNWSRLRRSRINEPIKAKSADQADLAGFIKKFLGKPYLLGGTTEKGIDCSALTQRLYKELYGVILPRHSADQAGCGERIEKIEEAAIGDLVFLRHKKEKYFHIGAIIYFASAGRKLNPEEVWILNARRQNGGTVIQDLRDILEDYRLISLRRIIKH